MAVGAPTAVKQPQLEQRGIEAMPKAIGQHLFGASDFGA